MTQNGNAGQQGKRGAVMSRFVISGAVILILMFILAPPSAIAADQVYASVNDYGQNTTGSPHQFYPSAIVWGYDGSSWNNTGLGAIDAICSISLDRTNNVLYAAGATAGNGLVYKLENGSWTDMTGTLALENVSSLIQTNAGLFAAGYTASGDGRVYKYDSGWVDTGLTGVTNAGGFAADSSGALYVGGLDATGSYGVVEKYNGTHWSSAGLDVDTFGSIYALATDIAGNIYAGGNDTNYTNGLVYKLTGTSWDDTGLTGYTGVYSLATDGSGNVYAGGQDDLSGVGAVAKYNGSWTDLAIGIGMSNDTLEVNSLAVDASGKLYAGGETYDSYAFAYQYDGSWSQTGISDFDDTSSLTTGYSPSGGSSVPEPSAMVVSGLAIGLIGLIKRFRQVKGARA